MIQRVQSIYLLLVTILMSFILIKPYAGITLVDGQSLLLKAHVITIQSGENVISTYKTTIPVIFLVLVSGFLSFFTIFLYHKRILQIRLTLLNMVFIVILTCSMLAYYFTVKSNFTDETSTLRLGMAFPVLALIFCTMAIRGIRHDELLVKSYDRIR
ncbi:MAG TPA: DUF4293 domain-containing protein [Bacteroidales bacterium]|nr:DUF4293 domain-containing protein [Bacteroidales bacterium]